MCVYVCICGVERGVERTHLPRHYCQSIIQGNASRVPWGRVHYALTTGSVLVSQSPCVIVDLRLCVCIFMQVSACITIECTQFKCTGGVTWLLKIKNYSRDPRLSLILCL